jgi:hypothetical protein
MGLLYLFYTGRNEMRNGRRSTILRTTGLRQAICTCFGLHVRWSVHNFFGRSVFRLQVEMYSGTNFAMCVSFVLNK